MTNSVDPDQTAPRSSLFWVHAVCFHTYSSVMLGNYLQQTTSADDIFRCIFLGALRVNLCGIFILGDYLMFHVNLQSSAFRIWYG